MNVQGPVIPRCTWYFNATTNVAVQEIPLWLRRVLPEAMMVIGALMSAPMVLR